MQLHLINVCLLCFEKGACAFIVYLGNHHPPQAFIALSRFLIIDTFNDVIGACTVTHNVLVGMPFST